MILIGNMNEALIEANSKLQAFVEIIPGLEYVLHSMHGVMP